MTDWLKKILASLRSFMRDNTAAHARSQAHGCCSAPPPGAGRGGAHGVK